MWHDSCICVTGPWRPPYSPPVPKTRQNDLILCVPWLVHTCAMPHSHVRHASFTCVICRILSHLLHMCNMVRLIHTCGITSLCEAKAPPHLFRTHAFRSCQFARDQFRTEYILTLINQKQPPRTDSTGSSYIHIRMFAGFCLWIAGFCLRAIFGEGERVIHTFAAMCLSSTDFPQRHL